MYNYDKLPAEGTVPLKDAVDLITSTTVSAVLFAYSFLIYCLSTRLFYFQLRDIDGKLNYHTIVTVVISSIIITCAIVDIVTLNLYARTIYSDINTLPAGPDGMLAEEPAFVPIKTNIIATFVETVVSLGTQVSLPSVLSSLSDAFSVVARLGYLEWDSICRPHHHCRRLTQCGRSR